MQYKVKGSRDRAVFCLNSEIPEHQVALAAVLELEQSLGGRKRSIILRQLVALGALQASLNKGEKGD